MTRIFEDARDFIILHYILNEREDVEFCKECRRVTLPDSLKDVLELYQQTGIVEWDTNALFRDTSYYSIFAGYDRLPRRHLAQVDFSNFDEALEIMKNIKINHMKYARGLSDNRLIMAMLHG